MKKWYLKRDELLNLLFHATQSGVAVESYENKVVDLMADGKRLEQNIANRPY